MLRQYREGLCAGAFALICVGLILFLSIFTQSDTVVSNIMRWSKYEVVDQEGRTRSFAPEGYAPALSKGESYRFSLTLPSLEKNPDLYGSAYLLFETGGQELELWVNGTELYSSRVPVREGAYSDHQARLSLSPEDAGGELVLICRPIGTGPTIFPPLLRYSSEQMVDKVLLATYNMFAFPAIICAVGFLLACGVFLLGVAIGQPDLSLPLLALASFVSCLYEFGRDEGVLFMPGWLYELVSSPYVPLVVFALLAAYLFLNRKRSFLRYLRDVGLFFILGLMLLHLISLLFDLPFASETVSLFSNLPYSLGPLLLYGEFYLLLACVCIAAYDLLSRLLRERAEGKTLSVRNELMLENYHLIEQSIQNTSVMRHEWRNNMTALQLLAQREQWDKLRELLDRLDGRLDQLSPQRYSKHFGVDSILRSIRLRADQLGVRFTATAILPAELGIDTDDLCSFLLNMLENALTAAAQVPPEERMVDVSLKLNQGHLAIRCQNSYNGKLLQDKSGRLRSTKPGRSHSGFGVMQMQRIAEKYHGVLDLEHDGKLFTVRTALKLEENTPAPEPAPALSGRSAE